jgi:dephospho-CoA kinase
MPNNDHIILGFSGLMASGKGTAATYLEECYGAATFRFSTMLRDALNRFYLPHTRDNLIKLSEIMRATFGEDMMAKTMSEDASRSDASIVVVEGIRRMADIEYLARLPNFVLVEIFADPLTRHRRITERGENPDDRTKTFEQFMADHARSTEMSIPEVLRHATEKIDNNGDIAILHRQLDLLVKKYTVSRNNVSRNQ